MFEGNKYWNGGCARADEPIFASYKSKSIVFKHSSCDTLLCNNPNDYKYLEEESILCLDGFYRRKDSTTTYPFATTTVSSSNSSDKLKTNFHIFVLFVAAIFFKL